MSLAEDRYSDERPLAPESLKTRRAREKLLKQWEEEKQQITPAAIAEAVRKMHDWIANNAKHRVPIKEKLELFNQNRDAAKLSSKVEQIAAKLKEDMQYLSRNLSQS